MIARGIICNIQFCGQALDPEARIEVWNMVKELADGGRTVFLTTQYLDESKCHEPSFPNRGVAVRRPVSSPDGLRKTGPDAATEMLPEDLREDEPTCGHVSRHGRTHLGLLRYMTRSQKLFQPFALKFCPSHDITEILLALRFLQCISLERLILLMF
jgi:hypothetical protein